MTQSLQDVRKSIVLTLAYSAQFKHGLSISQLYTRLVTKKPISNFDFNQALQEFLNQGLVIKKGDSYQLRGVPIRSFPSIDSKRQEIQSLVSFISKIPWVSAVIITGSVAVGTMKPQDDIDFLIVTQPNRLWLVRPLVVLFGLSKGRRRSWSHEEPNSWCFNFWLEETELAFAQNRWSMYTAFELCQAKFVFDRDASTEISFLRANAWVKNRLPHFFSKRMYQALQKKNRQSNTNEQHVVTSVIYVVDFWLGSLFTFKNYVLYLVQLFYMAPHRTSEQVDLKGAFFHPRDTKKILYAGWKSELARLLGTTGSPTK